MDIKKIIINPHSHPFVVLEGIDGCGKGTIIKSLKKHFTEKGTRPIFTKEPVEGPGKIGSLIRAILDNGGKVLPDIDWRINDSNPQKTVTGQVEELLLRRQGQKLTSEELQFLYITDRLLHRRGEARFLEEYPIISDRDWESTLCYHVASGGNPEWVVNKHLKIFNEEGEEGTEFFISNLTLIIDITAEEAVRRQREMGKKFDYFEDAVEKRKRLRIAYLTLPNTLSAFGVPHNIRIINGMRSREEVFRDVLGHVEKIFTRNKSAHPR